MAGDNKSLSSDDPQKAHTIDIVKDPDSQSVASGGTASFTITVTNTGQVALTNVNVTDANAPGCARSNLGTLAVGAPTSYTCTKTNVTSGFVDTATACGTAFATDDTCDSDTANVGIVSQSSAQDFKVNDTATVTVSGTNISPPNGSMTFSLYKGLTCDSMHLIYGPVTMGVNVGGSASTTNSTLLSTLVANAITAGKLVTAGTYKWQISYGGDTHGNAPITGACGTESFSVTNG